MNALVLAGARNEGLEHALPSGAYRAGLVVGGRTLLELALASLTGLPGLDRIVIVGPVELVPDVYRSATTRILTPGEDLLTNLKQGLAALPEDEPVLVVASDMPLLTMAALKDFVAKCAGREAEIYYPIIRREVYEAAYPGSDRTYLSVGDGTFTGGNMVLLSPATFKRYERLIGKAVAWRKQPRRLGRLLGFRFVIGLLMSRYKVAEIEAKVGSYLGLRVVAIETNFSEIGFDVDTSADMQWIEFYWGGATEGAARNEPILDEE